MPIYRYVTAAGLRNGESGLCNGEKHLDIHPKRAIINIEKGVAKKRLRPRGFTLLKHRNRHWPEWRFLRFTRIVTVHNRTWNVNVIGIATPPFGDVAEPPFFTLATPALAGAFILRGSTVFVNKMPPDELFEGIVSIGRLAVHRVHMLDIVLQIVIF